MRTKLFIFGLLSLCSCGTLVPSTIAVVAPVAPVVVPEVQPLTLAPVEWQVITVPQLKKLLAKAPANLVLFALDPKNFNNMSLNLIELERYINEQKATVIMLKNIDAARAQRGTPAAVR